MCGWWKVLEYGFGSFGGFGYLDLGVWFGYLDLDLFGGLGYLDLGMVWVFGFGVWFGNGLMGFLGRG